MQEVLRERSCKNIWKNNINYHTLGDSAVKTAAYVLSYFKESRDDDEDDVEKTETQTKTFKLTYLAFIFCL